MTKLLEKEKNKAAVAIGRLGGAASFKKRGKKGMSALGKKGSMIRWGNKSKIKQLKKGE